MNRVTAYSLIILTGSIIGSLIFAQMCLHKFFFGTNSPKCTNESALKGTSCDYTHNLNNLGSEQGYTVGVYYSNWSPYAPRLHFPHDIDFSRVSHVYYSFFLVDSKTGQLNSSDPWSDFEMDLYKPLALKLNKTNSEDDSIPNIHSSNRSNLPLGCIGELFYLKHANMVNYKGSRNFRSIMTVGGWSNREEFPKLVRDPKKMDIFIDSCVTNMIMYGFDGIDLDWEFPRDDGFEPNMYLQMVKRLRLRFNDIENDIFGEKNSEHPKFQLSVATPAFEGKLDILPIKEMDQYVDTWNMMTYDYHGSWSERTGYHSNLYSELLIGPTYKHDDSDDDESQLNANSAIILMTNKFGIQSRKISLGMAAYGRGFTKVKATKEDSKYISKKYKGVGGASEGEPGMWLYNQLPIKNSKEEFDYQQISAYCFDPKSKTFVGYDNVESMGFKARYVKDHALAGGFWWESCGDDHKNPERSLLNAFATELVDISKNSDTMFTKRQVLEYYLKIYDHKGFLSPFIEKLLDRKSS